MIKLIKPKQIENLFKKIEDCLSTGHYRLSEHTYERGDERSITLPDILYVLRNGYHEKQKTTFCEIFKTWKYSIRGKTVDKDDTRIIIAFDESDMIVITVINLSGNKA